MQIVLEEDLIAYMREKGKKDIVVEVITSDSSDFEVTELHTHFVSARQKEYFKTKKHFYSKETELGEVLLPPYRLEFSEKVTFRLKKFLFIRYVTQEGIHL